MPLAEVKKEDVRKLAKYYGLPNADKEESMGLCFVGERGKFGDFICESYGGVASFQLMTSSIRVETSGTGISRQCRGETIGAAQRSLALYRRPGRQAQRAARTDVRREEMYR